jgi:protocatechuate 3,4-dioxygenase beta subunit
MKKQSKRNGFLKLSQMKYLTLFQIIFGLTISSEHTQSAENADMVAQQKKYSIGCAPTPPDAMGPFYKPNAPVRSSVGNGYELRGVVISTKNCAAIPQARIELWMAGPDGEYKDDYRATVIPNQAGEYYFESHLPPSYFNRPPHIHMRVSADGFKTLVTQHYPESASKKGTLDLVLIPE